jgi:sulfite reductase alpha subunit-like flavoprotein
MEDFNQINHYRNNEHFLVSLPSDYLSNVKFATFGLGDSSYVFFNKSAIEFDDRFAELGATRLVERGLGDDKHDEKYETEWSEWAPNLFVEA